VQIAVRNGVISDVTIFSPQAELIEYYTNEHNEYKYTSSRILDDCLEECKFFSNYMVYFFHCNSDNNKSSYIRISAFIE